MNEPLHELPNLPDELVRRALQYAAGELDTAAAESFESRLRDEPAAQAALIDAVQLAALLAGRPAVPSPDYRTVVRQRCFRRAPFARHFCRAAGFGLVAALLAAVTVDPSGHGSRRVHSSLHDGPLIACGPAASDVSGALAASGNAANDDDDDMLETALEWAELSNCGDHLQRAWDDETRRRSRDRRHVGVEPSAWDGFVAPAGPNE